MTSIGLDHVSIVFPIYSGINRSLKSRLVAATTGGRVAAEGPKHFRIQALDDICATIANGNRVALIGRNGAGKTTLLRVLAGIYEPCAGAVVIEGRVAPLFDAGLGMDPESSGYENIILRGLYLGLSKAEINAKSEEIAAFTELGPFLDMPLRTYSSGMHARLAFAISTCTEPEILLLDEAVGAGDAAFLEKAKQRLDAFVSRAGILVLASHSEQLVRQFCTKAMLLDRGRVTAVGPLDEVFERYHQAA